MKAGFRWCPHCNEPHSLDEFVCPVTKKAIHRAIHQRTSAPEPDHPFIGTVLASKYRVQRSIGRGGMGEVFEAEDIVLRRPVAIKVVVNPNSEEAFLRLVREAQLVSAMQHPNICAIYDVGSLPGGSPFLVLERLHGETLAARLARQREEDGVLADIFKQVLSGIDAAHKASIIHRDLKPENIFLSERLGYPPHVKILDFGFAKDLSGKRTRAITRPGNAVGTPRYMAPEQSSGKGVDPRTDLFAVGLMLFEALTGAHPFDARNITLLHMNVLSGTTVKLSTLRPDLPPGLEPVIDRALARNMPERFPSASEMLSALLRALPSEDTPQPPRIDNLQILTLPRLNESPSMLPKLNESLPPGSGSSSPSSGPSGHHPETTRTAADDRGDVRREESPDSATATTVAASPSAETDL